MNLEGVEKTMLLTLFAKAQHSQKKNHRFFDQKAIDVISQIDYDFSVADKDRFMKYGVISRTIVLDEMVSDYIDKNPLQQLSISVPEWIPDSTDLTTDLRWYNIDLENSANFRLQYIEDNERVTTLAYSAMDPAWANEIKIESGNLLFIIEGLSMYLTEKDNKDILKIIADNFRRYTVFVEIMPPVSVENVTEKSVED